MLYQRETSIAVHSNSTSFREEEDLVMMDRTEDDVNQMNRPLSGIGDSVEEKKVDDLESEDAETRGESSKRSLGKTEALVENAGSREEPSNHGDKEDKTKLCLESSDENDLPSKAIVECEIDVGPSGSYMLRAKAKGKEKALSDGNFDEDDDESFGSVESCNSAGLLSRGKKRPGFEHQLILGSKRLKTLSRECLGSTSKLNQDSSFMNWISNMTKGNWNGNEQDKSRIVADDQCCLKENTGFQSFFESIYCPRKRAEMDFPNDVSLQKPPEQCLITNVDHLSSSDNKIGLVGSQTNKTLSSENEHEDKEPNISFSKSKPSEERKTNKNSGLESLWISRFTSKTSFPRKKDLRERIANETASEANDSASDMAKNPKTIPRIVSSLRIESSEAMASMFAKRVEALKHIMPSCSLAENSEKEQTDLVCFYCGKKDHCLRECLEVTDTELRDLVQNVGEEASSLCIRCFQLSHWAATCPNARKHSSGAMKHALASTSGTYVPKAVFDAVQLLRLTRTDVLKWMNTKKSVSGLEGFFLRIRLGKREEEIGGTGYYVARIDGAKEGQSSTRQSENSSVSVKVRGMTCFVESQFISNCDFLEEEVKAWWGTAGRSGGDGIPSEEELSRKIQERKMLGF